MNEGKAVFSQIMSYFSKYEFDRNVKRYKGNYKMRHFSCWDQFLCMSFAQLTYRRSSRDIEACLNAQPQKLYHMGIRGNVTRTNLANANQNRDWRIYAEFAQHLIFIARNLYQNDNLADIDLDNIIYALDSTAIDLCLSLFPWAKFRKRKGAVKLHTLLDLRGSIPTFIEITNGSVHDVNILDVLIPEAGSYYIMDRGYIDYKRLYRLNKELSYFIVRAKKNLKFKRLYSNRVDKSTGLRCDQVVKLSGYYKKKDYPETIRRVKFFDAENDKRFVFLTNNFEIPAFTVAGRGVYGGGGITPDIFIVQDTLNSFELEVRRNNVFFPFAVDFLSKVDIDENFYVEDELFDEFLDSILEKDIEFTDEELADSQSWLRNALEAQIISNKFGLKEGNKIAIRQDMQLQATLKLFEQYGSLKEMFARADELAQE